MDVILVHGMGRTPLSMLRLARRLRRAGQRPLLFAYSPTFETLDAAVARLRGRIRRLGHRRYALVGHSLGSVLIRSALADLTLAPPEASFFLAPPMVACRAARYFSRRSLYRILTGDMGQRLADAHFMQNLPMPPGLVRIYVGVRGPRAPWYPLGDEPNDAILCASEAAGAHAALAVEVQAMHTFIMNAPAVVEDLIGTLAALEEQSSSTNANEAASG